MADEAATSGKVEESEPIKLKMKRLGSSGCAVSELCLGTMTFGTSDKNTWGLGTAQEAESHAMIDRFAECGGNFIDTADIYGHGESEAVVGRYLEARGERDKWVIATKARFPSSAPGVNNRGNSRKHLVEACEASLKRLKTPYIDLYQLHGDDVDTPLSETFRALNDLVRSGKVRYIGLSNFSAWRIANVCETIRSLGLEDVVTLQPQYNLMCRATEWDLVPVCEKEGMGLLPWSPLKGGFLTGRYRRDMEGPEASSRLSWAGAAKWKETSWDYLNTETNWNIIDAICEMGERLGRSPAQISLRWLMQKPGVTAPIVGAKRMAHLNDNLGAATFELSAEDMKILDTVSWVEPPYPYNNRTAKSTRF